MKTAFQNPPSRPLSAQIGGDSEPLGVLSQEPPPQRGSTSISSSALTLPPTIGNSSPLNNNASSASRTPSPDRKRYDGQQGTASPVTGSTVLSNVSNAYNPLDFPPLAPPTQKVDNTVAPAVVIRLPGDGESVKQTSTLDPAVQESEVVSIDTTAVQPKPEPELEKKKKKKSGKKKAKSNKKAVEQKGKSFPSSIDPVIQQKI